jgi:hypothetical protein
MFDMSGCGLNDRSCKLNHGIYKILDTNLFKEINIQYGGWKRRGTATHFELLIENTNGLFKTVENTLWVRASGPHDNGNQYTEGTYKANGNGGVDSLQDDLDKYYIKYKNISSLVGNYFSLAFFYLPLRSQSDSTNRGGRELEIFFGPVFSIDAINDFKKELDLSGGKKFHTKIKVHGFLKNRLKRKIEKDGSIKLFSRYGDMRIYPSGLCCKSDPSNQDELDVKQTPEVQHSQHTERENVDFGERNVDFYKEFGGDGDRDAYLGDGISIRPDGSFYDDR